jgi:hypothetical protein
LQPGARFELVVDHFDVRHSFAEDWLALARLADFNVPPCIRTIDDHDIGLRLFVDIRLDQEMPVG